MAKIYTLFMQKRHILSSPLLSVSVYSRGINLECFKRFSSFQRLATTLQPVKLSSSRFTTTKDITLLSWPSIKIRKKRCMVVPVTDPLSVLIVGIKTSTYRTTLWTTKILLLDVALRTLSPRNIQLVTAGFSLDPREISSLPLTRNR